MTPVTWQGWLYVLVAVAPVIAVQYLPDLPRELVIGFFIIWGIVLLVDAIQMRLAASRDEREVAHEAIAERNALWVMLPILAAGFAYEMARSIVLREFAINYFVLIALIAGLATKAVTNLYLDHRD